MQIETKFASGEISTDRGQRDVLRRRFSQGSYAAAWAAANQSHGLKIEGNGKETPEPEQTETEHRKTERSQAETIYRAAASGKTSPEHVRAVSKVPYGYLAKDGVIQRGDFCMRRENKQHLSGRHDGSEKRAEHSFVGRRPSQGKQG